VESTGRRNRRRSRRSPAAREKRNGRPSSRAIDSHFASTFEVRLGHGRPRLACGGDPIAFVTLRAGTGQPNARSCHNRTPPFFAALDQSSSMRSRAPSGSQSEGSQQKKRTPAKARRPFTRLTRVSRSHARRFGSGRRFSHFFSRCAFGLMNIQPGRIGVGEHGSRALDFGV
jgi:hypothetical protein